MSYELDSPSDTPPPDSPFIETDTAALVQTDHQTLEASYIPTDQKLTSLLVILTVFAGIGGSCSVSILGHLGRSAAAEGRDGID